MKSALREKCRQIGILVGFVACGCGNGEPRQEAPLGAVRGALTETRAATPFDPKAQVILQGSYAVSFRSGSNPLLYHRSGGSWSISRTLAPPAGYTLTTSVLFGGNTISVGAFAGASYADPRYAVTYHADDPGFVEVFEPVAGVNSTPVAVDDSTLVIESGAPGSPRLLSFFERGVGSWVAAGSDTGTAGPVAVGGGRVIAGEPVSSGGGQVVIYSLQAGVWSREQVLPSTDVPNGDPRAPFGTSVAIDGLTAVVGADFDFGMAPHSQTATIYDRCGTSWTPQLTVEADATQDEDIGSKVAVSGNLVLLPGPFWAAPGSSNYVGHVFVEERVNGVWQAALELEADPPATTGVAFGSYISLDSGRCLIKDATGWSEFSFNGLAAPSGPLCSSGGAGGEGGEGGEAAEGGVANSGGQPGSAGGEVTTEHEPPAGNGGSATAEVSDAAGEAGVQATAAKRKRDDGGCALSRPDSRGLGFGIALFVLGLLIRRRRQAAGSPSEA